MAYSDYGGFGFKNGVRDDSMCDINVDLATGVKVGEPGIWPGFVAHMQGQPQPKGISGHVILQHGPVCVQLYKQGWTLHRFTKKVLSVYDLYDPQNDEAEFRMEVREFDGYKVSCVKVEADNTYALAEVICPDGTILHGASGYGVGCGLESGEHGYSSGILEELLRDTFPRFTEASTNP